MAVKTGFDVVIKLRSGMACTCTNDVLSLAAGGTCTAIPYLDSYALNGSRSMIETTAFGDKIAKVVPGIPSLMLDFSGGLDLTSAPLLAFWNNLACSAPSTRIVQIYDGGKTISVKGQITGQQLGSSPTGKSTFSASMQAVLLPSTV